MKQPAAMPADPPAQGRVEKLGAIGGSPSAFPRASPELWELLGQLYLGIRSRPSPLTAFSFRPVSLAPLVDQMVALGEVALLPHLLDHINAAAPDLRGAAERGVQVLLPRLSVKGIMQLEKFLRECRDLGEAFSGAECRATSAAALRLSSLAPNGYRREKALNALTAMADPADLPFVLLRLNDWVAQVRASAIRWFDACLASLSVPLILEAFPILAALTEREQGKASLIVDELVRRLETPEAVPLLISLLPSLRSGSRRFAIAILAGAGAFHDSTVQQRLLSHPDPLPGIFMLKYLLKTETGIPDQLARQAMVSKRLPLRRFAWYYLSPAQVETFLPLIPPLLFDPATGLRELAQFHLRKRSSVAALQAQYRAVMDDDTASARHLGAAIQGFHEVGGVCTQADYERWLRHSSSQVRAAALKAFATTSFDAALPLLKHAFADLSAGALAKVAYTFLLRRPDSITTAEIVAWLEPHQPRLLRPRGFVLAGRLGKWQQLSIFLRLIRVSDMELRERSIERLDALLFNPNRAQVQPTRSELASARVELDLAAHALSESQAAELEALLRTFAF